MQKFRHFKRKKILAEKVTYDRLAPSHSIIELGYRKISWFVSVSQINYLPQPSASASN